MYIFEEVIKLIIEFLIIVWNKLDGISKLLFVIQKTLKKIFYV